MSRIGNKPIPIPSGTTVKVDGDAVRIQGREGQIAQAMPPGIRAELKDDGVHLVRAGDSPQQRAFHGLARALVANGVQGVGKKFEKKLEIVGIGYRAALAKDVLTLNLGYSHPIEFKVPSGIDVEIEKQTVITVRGVDKQQVGQVAAEIRDFKRPDMYKGKGVRYLGEHVRQKVGKSGGK